MPSPRTFLVLNLTELADFLRRLQSNKEKGLDTAAKRLLQYYQKRFLALAAGTGRWAALSRTTIENKIKHRIAPNVYWILRESDTLYHAMDVRREGPDGRAIGIVKAARGPKATYRGKRAAQIAQYHQLGLGNNPQREIIVEPEGRARARVVEDIRRALMNFQKRKRK